MTRATGRKQAKLEAQREHASLHKAATGKTSVLDATIFDSCNALGRFMESFGAKQIWAPTKFRKAYLRDSDQTPLTGRKILVGIVAEEGGMWSQVVAVSNEQEFQALRHRPFYQPSTLWYEFPAGSGNALDKFNAYTDALLAANPEGTTRKVMAVPKVTA